MIGIVDYGAGNLHSIRNALEYLGIKNRIIRKPEDMEGVKRIILPGVGAFGAAVSNLKKNGLFEKIIEWIENGYPYLGICLGLQLLFESSDEIEGVKGFCILKGRMKRFPRFKIPQIGWNSVEIVKPTLLLGHRETGLYFYFLHSYYLQTPEKEIIIGITRYGISYPSIINKDNIYAVQFHPEKSGRTGLTLLKNWVERC